LPFRFDNALMAMRKDFAEDDRRAEKE